MKRAWSGVLPCSSPGKIETVSISSGLRQDWKLSALRIWALLEKCMVLPWMQSDPGSIYPGRE